MIGKIERVPLREVWKHEALDFTTWLQDNIGVLDEALDISLSSAEREQSAGDFAVDIVAEDESGNIVIIENQLAKSDHDHLGKLITYLTALEAKAAIWIVEEPRPEHVKAIGWLNESSPASFYLVKVEALRIADSPPAPLLTLIVGPSEEGREVGETKKQLAERQIMRRRFWTQLLQMLRGKTSLHASVSPRTDSWLSTGAGKTGLTLDYAVRQHSAGVYLWISRGKEALEETKQIYESFCEARAQIEEAFGEALTWKPPEGRLSAVIEQNLDLGGWRDEDKWPEIHEAMIDAMIRLEKALRAHIDALDV